MCRLFAFIATNKDCDHTNLFSICKNFYSLAETGNVLRGSESGHTDGFGIHVERLSDQYTYKTSNRATDSHPILVQMEHILPSACLVSAHIRKRTNTDGEVSMQNNHPFVHSGLTFIHNGAVKIGYDEPYKDVACLCNGETDTERIFEKILKKKINGETTESAWVETLTDIRNVYRDSYTALNTIFTTPDSVYVSRIINEKHPEYQEREFDSYFTLYIAETSSGVYICSEPICSDIIQWSQIKNNSYIKISRKNNEIIYIKKKSD